MLLLFSLAAGHRKSNAFLDVPTMNMHHLRVNDDDEDVDRLRTFSASKGGKSTNQKKKKQ